MLIIWNKSIASGDLNTYIHIVIVIHISNNNKNNKNNNNNNNNNNVFMMYRTRLMRLFRFRLKDRKLNVIRTRR